MLLAYLRRPSQLPLNTQYLSVEAVLWLPLLIPRLNPAGELPRDAEESIGSPKIQARGKDKMLVKGYEIREKPAQE